MLEQLEGMGVVQIGSVAPGANVAGGRHVLRISRASGLATSIMKPRLGRHLACDGVAEACFGDGLEMWSGLLQR